jgi:hypothetical protein
VPWVGVSLTLCKSPGKAIEHRDRPLRDPTDRFAADDALLECVVRAAVSVCWAIGAGVTGSPVSGRQD